MFNDSKTAKVFYCFTFFIFLLCSEIVNSQNTFKRDNVTHPIGVLAQNISNRIPKIETPQPDWQKIAQEDKGEIGNLRYAVPSNSDYSTLNAGAWQIAPDGKNVWQVALTSSNAVGLALTLESVNLKEGESIFVYAKRFNCFAQIIHWFHKRWRSSH